MFRRCRNLAVVAILAIALPSPHTFACGPFFPSTILSQGDDVILNTPTADFVHEVSLIGRDVHPPFKSIPPDEGKDPFEQSLQADAAQLQCSLDKSGTKAVDRDKIVAGYLEMRGQINSGNVHADISPGALVPAGLPPEFADYLVGIDGYRNDQMNDARAAFRKILSRPAEQRRDRAVNAAFMIGKSYLHAHPEKSILWFQRTREYAKHFPDPLGLAASSYGWEARANLALRNIEQAIDLYLLQDASGDPTAAMSLRTAAEHALRRSPEAMRSFTTNAHARQVITALILANGGPFDHQPDHKLVSAWLDAIESAQIKDLAGADRLAWLMYQAGRFDDAGRWVARANQNAPMTLWVNAKLLLRDGKFEAGMKLLARAAKEFPSNEEWAVNWPNEGYDDDRVLPAEQIDGEMGAIALSRGQYVQSLDLLLKGRWLEDAAYVAERVLRADELIGYVDRSWPPEALNRHRAPTTRGDEGEIDTFSTDDAQVAVMIRELLARRLVRLGRCQDARPYFSAANQALLDAYVSSIRDGYDLHRRPDDRADSLFTAARIARDNGMELMGTELGPDWETYGGDFEGDDPSSRSPKMLSASADESRRVADTAETINRRFHYRYVAADFAWSAAQLLPDNSDELAEICCEAGSWLKGRDPQAADRFYQVLVKRCRATRLGKEAMAMKWFPSTQPSR